MKPTWAQSAFFVGVFFWLAILQAFLLSYLSKGSSFACNGGAAWPLSLLAFPGSGPATLFVTLLLFYCAWKALASENFERKSKEHSSEPFLWAMIVGTGASHSLERLSSGCILDYWHIEIVSKGIYFNLGDVSLAVATATLIALWLCRYRKKWGKLCL